VSALSHHEHALLQSLQDRSSAMVETTRRLADINSGSDNRKGIERVNNDLGSLFGGISDRYEAIALDPIPQISDSGVETSLSLAQMQIFSSRVEAPLQLLCTGHSDTVFSPDSNFQTSWIEGGRLRGPGVADMKGGLVVLREALNAINNSPFRQSVGYTVAISPDEEIGSPSSAAVLTALAKKADFGLTYEPALADGTLAGARKGSGNFSCIVSGKSAHAGRDFFAGKNAVTAAARLALQLQSLSDEEAGISVNIGRIGGGGPVNIVPDTAVCRFNIRVQTNAQQSSMEEKINTCIADTMRETGCNLELHGKFHRPAKPATDEQHKMFELLTQCGAQLDIDIMFRSTGGCCEGNNLAAAGLVNIDTLGVRGGQIHSHKEFACIDSFVERAQLSALFIAKLCQKERI